jgi:hypothetical protein
VIDLAAEDFVDGGRTVERGSVVGNQYQREECRESSTDLRFQLSGVRFQRRSDDCRVTESAAVVSDQSSANSER